VTGGGRVGRDRLMLIEGEDIRKSRLFDTDGLMDGGDAAEPPDGPAERPDEAAETNGHRAS
jgi:hypothetical protein